MWLRPAEGTGSPRAGVMDHCKQPDVSLEVHEHSQLTGPVCALCSLASFLCIRLGHLFYSDCFLKVDIFMVPMDCTKNKLKRKS